MSVWHSASGRPLASYAWLEAHHRAKLPEREAFAKLIAQRTPSRIVDLGCGPGLWLALLAAELPSDCELYGIDTDELALDSAREIARHWMQPTTFQNANVEASIPILPDADVFLAFNIFPYVADPGRFLEGLRSKIRPGGCLIVRQYDGALLRVGPMDNQERQMIDRSLMTAVLGSGHFKHYDLDRVFDAIAVSRYSSKSIDFEVFRRVSPYPPAFRDYLSNTIAWTDAHISDDARERLQSWVGRHGMDVSGSHRSYFMEVDLVAWLS